jgi:hypothetical protein
VTVNGTKVGIIHRYNSENAFQEVVTWMFSVPVGILTGNDHVMIDTSGGDGFIIDYSNLAITMAH